MQFSLVKINSEYFGAGSYNGLLKIYKISDYSEFSSTEIE